MLDRRNPAFPKTVCGVVFQGAARRSGCQFSFACDGSMNRGREFAAISAHSDRSPPHRGTKLIAGIAVD